jgi:hemoglobin
MKTLTALLCSLLFTAGTALAQAPVADDATYQGLGGKQGIKDIVETFVTLVLADARINANFKDTDKANLKMRLGEQFCELSGGPCKYGGKSMVDIHDGLNITTAQFNALAEQLQVAMEQHNVPARVQNKLVAKLAPMHSQMVIKK